MGATQQCCQKSHFIQSEEIVTLPLMRKKHNQRPDRQNLLTPPLIEIADIDDAQDQFWFEAQLNQSIHKTATFNSSSIVKSARNQQSLTFSLNCQNADYVPDTNSNQIGFTNTAIQDQFATQNLFVEQVSKRPLEQQPTKQVKPQLKPEESPPKKQQQQRKSAKQLSRSFSSNAIASKRPLLQGDEISKKSDTHTKKSILRNKGKAGPAFNRGLSLRQQKPTTDDTQSVKTNKSANKKVSFDPKIFRPKNQQFFY